MANSQSYHLQKTHCGHHGCGHHGHCLWPLWFVAVIVEPQTKPLSVYMFESLGGPGTDTVSSLEATFQPDVAGCRAALYPKQCKHISYHHMHTQHITDAD